MKGFVLTILVFVSFSVFSQTSEEEFEEAKRLFRSNNYQSAISAFGELTDDPVLGSYASFYYALASHRAGKDQQAFSMWKQVLSRYPDWEQKHEVLNWLVYKSLDLEKYKAAIDYASALPEDSDLKERSENLIRAKLATLDLSELRLLYRAVPTSRLAGYALAKRLSRQPEASSEDQLLDSLITVFDLDRLELMNMELRNEFKDRYAIALVLPFMFSSLENPVPVIRNSLIMDLYQGMKQAQKDLSEKGVELELHLFDTDKSAERTERFLDELRGMDLIVGPFYPGPVEVISRFSVENKINIINPLTENIDYLTGNPLAFLFKPSYLTSAEKLAQWVVGNVEHKDAMILYDQNERDSLFAATYKSLLEKDSFQIVSYLQIGEKESKALLDSLVEQYEEFYSKEVADSIAEIPGRFIKERRLRTKEEKDKSKDYPYYYAEDDEDHETKLLSYENKFKVKKDSIGSILLASKANPIVNNIISAVATRGDTTLLLGYGDWLEYKSLNFQQMELLGTKFVVPAFVNRQSTGFEQMYEELVNTYQKVPTEYHLIGYELLRFVGENLDIYGKYFQLGLYETGYQEGYLTEGFNYQNSNDNQVVPIVEIQDLQITPINKSTYANRK